MVCQEDLRECLEKEGALLAVDVPAGQDLWGKRVSVWQGNRRVSLLAADWALEKGVYPLHLAYLARLRRLLGARLEDWEVTQGLGVDQGGLVPDAFWYLEGRRIPVEVDLGQYNEERLLRKLAYYHAAYGEQVWGVLSERPVVLGQRLRVKGRFRHLEGKGDWFLP